MNQRELVLSALAGQHTHRFPVIGPGGLINVINRTILNRLGTPLPAVHYSSEMMAELATAAFDMMGFDNVGVPLCLTVEAEALGARVDMGDAVVLPRIVSFTDLTAGEILANALPAGLSHGRIPEVIKAVALLRHMRPGVPIVGNLAGPATIASSLLRPSALLRLAEENPEVMDRLLEGITSFQCAYAEALIENGAEVLMIHEPAARGKSYKGFDLFGLVLPHLKDLGKYTRLGGARVILHVCGGQLDRVRMSGETQMDAYSFDSDVDPGKAGEILGKPIIGTVPASLVNHFPPEMVLEETLMAVRRGATMITPPCGLGLETPFQNLRIMKEASHRFRP